MADWEDAPARSSATSGWEDAPTAKGGWEDAPTTATKTAEVKAEAPTTDYSTDAMGADIGSSIMDVAAPKKGKSIFENGVKLEPPNVDYEKNLETMRRSGSPESVMFRPGRQLEAVNRQIEQGQAARRAAVEKAAEQAATKKFLQEREAEIEGYGPLGFAKDVGVALGKGTVSLGQSAVGLAEIATGWYPDNPLGIGQWGKMLNKLGYDPERTNQFLTGLQTPQSQLQQQEVQDTRGFFNTIGALGVNPLALVDSIVQSLPGTVGSGAAGGQFTRFLVTKAATEAADKGLVGVAAKQFIEEKVRDKAAQIALAASAAEGAQTTGSIADQARAAGKDWGEYVAPALAAGFGTTAIGATAGKIASKFGIGDIETEIAARAAGVRNVGVGQQGLLTNVRNEMIKEGVLEELPQGTQEQIFTNLATGRPWNEGVPEASAQSLMAGAGMGGGHAVLARALQKVEAIVGKYKPLEDRLIDALDKEVATTETADRAAVEEEMRQAEEYRNAPPVEESVYEGPEPPDIFGPPSETPTEAVVSAPTPAAVETPAPTGAAETVAPEETPLHGWMKGINPALDKFYNSILEKPLSEIPKEYGRAKVILESFNDGIKFVRDALARWDHPAITGKTESERRIAKTKNANAEERELLDLEGELAGLGVRVAYQFMALAKGYKGKKAGSMEKIDAAEAEALKLFERGMDLMYARGLLDESTTADYEENKGISKPDAIVQEPEEPTPVTSTTDEWEDATVPEAVEPSAPVDAADSITPKAEAPAPYYGTEEVNVLGNKIKETAEKIASDYMVGDDVRVGNVPGVVVGTEGDYIKFRPDNAVSPKAYQRVPKRNVTFVSRPNTVAKSAASKSADQEKKFGSEQGKLNADMGGLIQLLGANMYAASIAEVTVKELLQNAFDAVKGAVSDKKAPSLYKTGEITIEFNGDDRTITIQDNARGMTPEIVRDAFFTVAGSDKSDLDPSERSGGLGLAKMGFMLGAERLILDTVRDGVRVTVNTSAKDIADSKFQIVKKPAPKGEHGTTVTVKIPEYYIDPKTGEQKTIYFSDNASYYDALKQPLIGPVQVTVKKTGFFAESEVLQVGVNFPKQNYQEFKVNFGWGSADIYFGKTRKEGYGIKHQVLSSGVYQFNTEFSLSQTEKIPFDIIVNVKPNVEAKHPDYPFENSRERFKGRLKEDIESLALYLRQIALGHEAANLKESFQNIVSMPRLDLGADVADASKKLHKAFDKRTGRESTGELPPLPQEVNITGTQVIARDTGKVLADRAKKEEKQTKGSFTAETAAPTRSEFMTQMDQDPKLPIFHNNTNVDLLEVGRQYGNPEVFFAELGTLLVEMKEALGNSRMYGYDVLKPENLFFAGISVDKKYGGVHIKVPYKAVLLNPFYSFGAKTLFGVRQQLLNTMIHEVAHTGDMDHGVGHNTQMIKVEQYLADQGLYDYFRDAILEVLVRHESAFTAMREAYGQSTTQNTAKSLEDYGSKSSAAPDGGDGGSSVYQLGAVPSGERLGGDGDIRPAAPTNPLVGVRRSGAPEGGAVADTSVKGKYSLHPSVVEAINRNDVNGALRALAQNTSGLFADLATRLAELNLPSSIGFKQGRDLVRRAIDARTSQQQTRLFAYISRMYPDLYDKYFKNYDRSENLEQVAAGLREFEKAKYNKAPVAAEYADVTHVFNKTMPGLTAPGAFYPAFDAIDLNPHPQLGTSNRVFLHEVVHAATEYLLFGGAPLTDRQQAAVASLYEMYNYAQEKLPPNQYGFTNISEFIAEAMTNSDFQKKLKTVYYKQEKSTIFNSLVRTIMRLFGKDNLASAAMSEANELFSAYRPTGIVNIGPRFSKRVRGPISKPDTWRTAESVQQTITGMVKDATLGRMSMADMFKDISGSLWSASGWAVRAAALPIMPLRLMKDLTRTKFPQITGAVDIVEQMTTYRGHKLKIAENITQSWAQLQAKFPKQSSLMGRIMIEATIRSRDPDAGVPAGAAPDALDNAWAALRPEFKSLYRDVRDFYADSVKEMVKEMKQRAMQLPKAERQAMIKKINDQFGPGKLVAPYFPLRRFGNFWMQVGKGNFKEFYSFESPMGRYLAFQKRKRALSKGNALQKALVDTMRMGNGISELYNKNVSTTDVLRDTQELINGLSSTNVQDLKKELNDSLNQLIYLLLPQQSMRKMFINRRAIQGASGDMLRVFAYTAVHSAYQQARFKYADKFVSNINNAKEYIDEFASPERASVYRDYVHELEKRTQNVLGVEDKSPAAKVVGGITNTTFFFMLTAPASALLNIIGATAVTMPYIGGRYGYAKTNALMLKNLARYTASTPKRSLLPLVTGDFSNVSFPSIVEGGGLSPLLQRAADRFVTDGDINISMTNDIFELGDRPSDLYTGRTSAVKKVLSAVFHQAERLNREVSLLSTFELAYDKYNGAEKKDLRGVIERDANGKALTYTPDEAFEIAIGEARDIAGISLGDFSRQMKGRIFTVPGVNLLTQFKQYAITATYAILRNFYLTVAAPFNNAELAEYRTQMEKDKLPQNVIDQRIAEADQMRREIYREGRRRLAGILGMTFMYGGVAAMPFFSLGLGTLIKAAFSGDDDDDEFFNWENWFYNYMVSEVGGAAGAMFAKMGMSEKGAKELGEKTGAAIARGPVSAVTGASLSDRVSLDLKNLWYREGKYSPDARETVKEEIIANLGPSVGLGLNWADAYKLASEGQYARAFETAAPAVVSKPVTAYRLGTQGATTRGGDVIGGLYSDQFSLWELSLQSIGLQPEKLAVTQKRAIQAKTYEQKVLDRKTALMNRIWMERESPEGLEAALEKAAEFSMKYPEVAITPKSIADSFESRNEAKAKAEAIGAKLNEKLLPRTYPMLGK